MNDLDSWWEKSVIGDYTVVCVITKWVCLFMEQNVLNIAHQDEIVILPAIFNVKTEMPALSYREIMTLRKPINWFTEDEFNETIKCPLIIYDEFLDDFQSCLV